ncbi:MAG TPA: SIMPL domain-containing protein [Candidatus Saccharimonadales bacterium]|nr:SIMPL domain-containing protein [Candidatus Saccharimonadales bacterium]
MTASSNQKVNLALDLRFVVAALIIVIIAMLLVWRPWSGANDRTIEVTGEATLKAVPDEFVFYPSYTFKNADKNAALAELAKKSDEIVAKLKELGVSESGIKTNTATSYDTQLMPDSTVKEDGYTLQLTVTVGSQELAQKVQNYLVTTTPTGAVSPQPTFSKAKQKELEFTARDRATKDAKQKAEQTATNLGFKLGSVKIIRDGAGFGGIEPYPARLEADQLTRSGLDLHPGENELSYTVTVTYFIR